MAFGEILKEIPTALKEAQASADTRFEPQLVCESGTVPAAPGVIEKCEDRFEELDSDD